MKIEDLRFVKDANECLGNQQKLLADIEAGKFSIKNASGIGFALPKPHLDAIQALIVSGLRQQIADTRKVLTDRGVVLPEA